MDIGENCEEFGVRPKTKLLLIHIGPSVFPRLYDCLQDRVLVGRLHSFMGPNPNRFLHRQRAGHQVAEIDFEVWGNLRWASCCPIRVVAPPAAAGYFRSYLSDCLFCQRLRPSPLFAGRTSHGIPRSSGRIVDSSCPERAGQRRRTHKEEARNRRPHPGR